MSINNHEGNDYVLAVVDAVYRSGETMIWSENKVDTPLQNNTDSTDALADKHTGKYNTDLILGTYTPTDYPAFNFARNACTVTLYENTYYSVLPNLIELQLLYNNKDVLDKYDPTATTYPYRTMSGFKCGSIIYELWSSTEKNYNEAWRFYREGNSSSIGKLDNFGFCGVCPVICISLN